MKFLALAGSFALATYLVFLVIFTATNLSKFIFELNRDNQSYRFWARQGLIFLWPLVGITREGREALSHIWEGTEL